MQTIGRKTWQFSYDRAKAEGGRLPTQDEVKNIIDRNGGAPLETDAQWVPVGTPVNKDWVFVGVQQGSSNTLGDSHVDRYGYPGWGDDVQAPLHGVVDKMIVYNKFSLQTADEYTVPLENFDPLTNTFWVNVWSYTDGVPSFFFQEMLYQDKDGNDLR